MEQTHLSFKCMDTTPNKLKMMVSTQARLWSPAVNFGGDDCGPKGGSEWLTMRDKWKEHGGMSLKYCPFVRGDFLDARVVAAMPIDEVNRTPWCPQCPSHQYFSTPAGKPCASLNLSLIHI